MSTQWFYRTGEDEFGPVSPAELKQLASRGQLQPDHEVRRADHAEWTPAERIKGLFSPSASGVRSPTPPPQQPVEPVVVKLLDAGPNPAPLTGLRSQQKLLLISGIGCGVLTLFGGFAGLVLILLLFSGQQTIADAKNEEQIAKAVGFVVCGAKVTTAAGEEYQEGLPILQDRKLVSSLGTGSCFAVSEDGYLITNKHVIEGVWKAVNPRSTTT